jgi:hypothetical protein
VNDPGHAHRGYHNRTNPGDVSFIVDASQSVATDFTSTTTTAPSTTGITLQNSTTGITVQPTGGGQPVSTVPAYVGLVYIMRIR